MNHSKNIANDAPVNRLLRTLSPQVLERLQVKFEIVEMDFGGTLAEVGDEIKYVYFPHSGILSLLAVVDGNSSLEVALVGNEGMVSLEPFFGVNRSQNRIVVQGNGMAVRMECSSFVGECRKSEELTNLMLRYADYRLRQVSQAGVCYRFHSVSKRLVRWLLMTSDRMETNEFRITQEFLSHMLGVRREAVNRAARLLQKKNLISYSHGHILIVDRPDLEEMSCECYAIIRDAEISLLKAA